MTETMADTRMQGIFEEEEARAEEERLRKQEEKKLDNALKSLMETRSAGLEEQINSMREENK